LSHAKERKENNCLNCNAIVAGRFCQVCGQENIETAETFGHLAGHFVSDIFHFDGQFFSTAKYLLFKPGFLTHEYVRGRRASYLNPIKMYFFLSAVFFILFTNMYKPNIKADLPDKNNYTAAEVIAKMQADYQNLDSLQKANMIPAVAKSATKAKMIELQSSIVLLRKDTTKKREVYNRLEGPSFFGENAFDTEAQYDSSQQRLPPAERDGWFMRKRAIRNIELTQEFHNNQMEMVNGMIESFEHHVPQMLFVSLPIFALLLQLLYVRHKSLFYANHLIYTLHLYCALFIFFLAQLLLDPLIAYPYLKWIQWVEYGLVFYFTYYTLAALHEFYGQGWGKTIVKWALLSIAAFFVMLTLFVLMIFITIMIV
jgi:hypothetical protein